MRTGTISRVARLVDGWPSIFGLLSVLASPVAIDAQTTRRQEIAAQLAASREEFPDAAAWQARRAALREGFLRGAGLWPLPSATDLKPIIYSRREFDGYSVENVALETMPGFFCTGNLYRPLGQATPGPAILCPHGHYQPLGRLRADQQIRCAQFARLGATVFSYSLVGWQDSQQTSHADPQVLALQTLNSLRALDFVCGLKEVDPDRVGVTGASGGGTQTLYLAALDDRVRASSPVVIVYPWAAPDGCKCEGGLPVMANPATNIIELGASIAPRAQLLISCGGDETRDFPQVGFPFFQHVYDLHEAGSHVANLHLPDEGHDYGPSKRQAVYDFFATHLGFTSRPEELERITIEPPEALLVFDHRHRLPAHALHGSEQIAAALKRLVDPSLAQANPNNPDPAATPVAEGEDFFFVPQGFDRAGQVARAAEVGSGRVHIVVRDASGQPTPCRIAVVGADGNFYQPASDYLSKYALTGQWPADGAWGNRVDKAPYRYLGRYFYSTGEVEVLVPPGRTRVEVAKGPEYAPQVLPVELAAGEKVIVDLTLHHSADMPALGYWSGDPHLHLPRTSERDEDTILTLLAAEDIRYGSILAYNEPAGPYAGLMERMDSPQMRGLGVNSVLARDGMAMIGGQEYRTSTYGHLLVFLRDGLVHPGEEYNADNWPVYGDVGRETQALGGLSFYAHGGYALEIYADAALGTVDGVELLQFGVYRGIGLEDWYHILNSGYQFPQVGASDWPACRFLGDCRTYVQTAEQPTFPDWWRGAALGRSFATTGPLVLLEVDGQPPGARLTREGAGPHAVTARVRVRCELTPVTHLDLIVNGQVAKRLEIPPESQQGEWAELEVPLALVESAWIAARAWSTTPGGQPDAEAHTNPVYVTLGGRAVYREASLDIWLSKIDAQIAVHRQREFAERPRVLDYFQQARDRLLAIRAAGGLPAQAGPVTAQTAASGPSGGLATANVAASGLASDASTSLPTDAELAEFLKPLPPLPPAEALKTIETLPGFHVELVAAEPQVYDPVAAAFDADGNLYVCEMRDYPYKPAEGETPRGSVRLLRDLDDDGSYETSSLFADGLLWAAGVAPWKKGVFIAAPPSIWYCEDTSGDGVADIRRAVYTGFGTDNQQAMLNNLAWGFDHWIYGVTAGNGGAVTDPAQPDFQAISVNGRDFRFDPARGTFETITGTVQFGNTFDDWGNRFTCSESQPLEHIVLPQHYLARNPFLPVPGAIQNIAPGPVPIWRISPVERWRQIRSSRRIATGERNPQSAGASHHVVDAAAGVTIYRGAAYPPEYYGTVFTSDGQNNLIHHRRLIPAGVTFDSERVEADTEFARSSDLWFRPVNLLNAPDGTLYCLDMSREVLESIHIPLDVVKHLDLTSGRDNGRIYRIAPDGFTMPPPPRLSQATAEELVQALSSPHGWWRDTAQRLIYERQDPALVPLLEVLAETSPRAATRILALWSLAGLSAVTEPHVARALGDPHPAVREQALRLAEPLLRAGPSSALLERVRSLAGDRDPRVRFQLAFTLGETSDPGASQTLAELAVAHADDVWMRTAVLSSVAASPLSFLEALLANEQATAAAGTQSICEHLAEVLGARHDSNELRQVLSTLAGPTMPAEWRGGVFYALCRGLKRSGARLDAAAVPGGPAAEFVAAELAQARQRAADPGGSEPQRAQAISLVGCLPWADVGDLLAELASVQQPQGVQIAAVQALADYSEAEVALVLLDCWRQAVLEVRPTVQAALFARVERTRAWIDAAQRGEASLAEVDAGGRELLRRQATPEQRSALEGLLGGDGSGSRATVIAAYRGALALPADAPRGREVFVKHCATCHQLQGQGFSVGPNLASSPSRDAEALLTHILDPSQYVLPNYVQYTVTDQRGRIFTGLIAAQTATSLTLKRERDATETLLRADIDELETSRKSLMPEGLEREINEQQMADLLLYLRQATTSQAIENPNGERDFGTIPGLVEPE